MSAYSIKPRSQYERMLADLAAGQRRYRTETIQAGRQTLTAARLTPDDLAVVLAKIHGRAGVH